MKETKEMVRCGNCKTILLEAPDARPDQRAPCPSCGSRSRLYEVTINETIAIHAGLGMKAKHQNENRPFIEQRSGSDLFRKTGKYNERTIVVDRENDLYEEIIKDPKTGEVIHQYIEPLSKHIGHGDAKNKKKK